MFFWGATGTYRDTSLPEDLIDKYTEGMIITERGFVDSSAKMGGFTGNLRYLIISTQNKAMPELFEDRGHCMLQSGSCFKVLDKSTSEGKTQITLLHIPRETIEFFESVSVNLEQEIVEVAHKKFQECLNMVPVPELLDDEWISRTAPPLGMDDDGNLFNLEV